MDLLLGLDVGTTATKALLFDLGRRSCDLAGGQVGGGLWRGNPAGVGAGVLADSEAGYDAFRQQEVRLEPDTECQKRYDDCFAAYCATSRALNRHG